MELDHFARNCKNPHYLAFLDAVNTSWSAPDWVYEQVERLPDISYQDYMVDGDIQLNSDGHLQMDITNAADAVARVDYRLYMASDKVPGGFVTLGMDDDVDADWTEGTFWDKFDGTWPMIGDAICQIEMISSTSSYTLYNVTIGQPQDPETPSLGYNEAMLRVGFEYDKPLTSVIDNMYETAYEKAQADAAEDEVEEVDPYAGEYVLYGVWNETASNIGMASRDVTPIDSLYGETFSTLGMGMSPLSREEEGLVPLGEFVLTEDVVIEDKPLPAGEYAYQFVITDVFGNEWPKVYVPFEWDGEKVTYDYEEYQGILFFLQWIGAL